MFSDDNFDDLVIRAADITDDFRVATNLHDIEQRNLKTESDEARDLELALKLSAEFQKGMTNQNSVHASPIHLKSCSTSNVVGFDKDEDFKLALKLSKELNDIDLPSTSRKNLSNSSVSNIVTFNEDEDFELAVKLSEELNKDIPKNDLPSKSHVNSNNCSVSNIVTFDEDGDFELAVKLSEQLNKDLPKNDLPSTSHASSRSVMNVVTFDEDKDFELALKLSMELSNTPTNFPSSNLTPSRSDVTFNDDRDFELALKLSEEWNSDYLQNGVTTCRNEGLQSRANPISRTPTYDIKNAQERVEFTSDDEDIIVENVVREIIGSEQAKAVRSSPPNFRMPAENSETVKKYLSKDISVVDPTWETIDPNPDIYAMFVAFNRRFFGGTLDMVEVKWSPRMTLCAGICTYQRRAGHCIVKLSKPLLQLRPRKDLVETLLHEMIHAYLFVTKNDRDRDGHGPRFHSHMYRINRESGANITVYHSFHEEVKYYKQHEWRCNGPCRDKPPFYGFVRRSMNRAPGPNDNWWFDHTAICNGHFVKTKEPEGYATKKAAAERRKALDVEAKVSKNGIANYFKVLSSNTNSPVPGTLSAPSKFLTASKNATTTSAIISTLPTNQKIFTLSDLANNKHSPTKSNRPSGSPKKWVPLPGQRNILHFVNKS